MLSIIALAPMLGCTGAAGPGNQLEAKNHWAYLGDFQPGSAYEVQSFCVLYHEIEGSLLLDDYLGELDLSCLEEVTGDVVHSGGAFDHLDLTGLETVGGDMQWAHGVAFLDLSALRTVGGSLQFEQTALAELDVAGLESVGGTLRFDGSGSLSEVSLTSLTSVGGDVELQDVGADFFLPAWSSLEGTLTVAGDSGKVLSAPALTAARAIDIPSGYGTVKWDLIDLSALRTVDQDVRVWLSSQASEVRIDSLQEVPETASFRVSGALDLRALTTVGDSLVIYSGSGLQTLNLDSLESAGSIHLAQVDDLEHLYLPSLTSTAAINLTAVPDLAVLHAPAIEELGELTLHDLAGYGVVPALQELRMDALQHLDDDLELSDVEDLELIEFPSLIEVGEIQLADVDALQLADFSALVEATDFDVDGAYTGGVAVIDLSSLQTAEHLDIGWGVAEIDLASLDQVGTLWVSSLALTVLDLPNLTDAGSMSISGSLEQAIAPNLLESGYTHFANSPDLEDIDFSSLERLSTLRLSNLPALTALQAPLLSETSGSLILDQVGLVDLDGLASITDIGGLQVSDNPNLVDIAALESLSAVRGDLEIVRNEALDVWHIHDVLGAIGQASFEGSLTIADNLGQ